jgi:hypothetical protein
VTDVVVFAGPTLCASEVAAVLPDALCRGPAACGDVYRATWLRPQAIALCDGYFDHRLSVWHKEILWALSLGIRVYGASSMGALRAAELAPFGMVGVGRIFEGYVSGELVGDDEVAVVHEPSDRGYRMRSDALVDIRATLEAGVALQVLSPAEFASLLAALKGVFYAERRYELLPSLAVDAGMSATDVAALRRWLAGTPRVSQKHADGLAMLRRVADDLRTQKPAAAPSFVFRNTDAWQQFRKQMDGVRTLAGHAAARRPRPAASHSPGAWSSALERALALALADSEGHQPTALELQEHSEAFRKRNELFDPAETQSWLESNRMNLEDFSRFIYEDLVALRFRDRVHELARDQLESLPLASDGQGASRPM